jgi:hypothetical protein
MKINSKKHIPYFVDCCTAKKKDKIKTGKMGVEITKITENVTKS